MNHGLEEHIVGYDAREFSLPFDWSEENRERFLYRLDITKPLSIDSLIWPSIFTSEKRSLRVDPSGFQRMWSDLALLRNALTLAQTDRPLHEYRMIAATLVLGDYCKNDRVNWQDRVPPITPAERGPEWKFIGYDVADQWALSGISDCGFLPGYDDVPALRSRWAPLLNKWHLFDEVEAAMEFKRVSDERMKDDHAPFFIFGLWLVT